MKSPVMVHYSQSLNFEDGTNFRTLVHAHSSLAYPVGTAYQLKSHSALIHHCAIKSCATINQGEGPIGKGL